MRRTHHAFLATAVTVLALLAGPAAAAPQEIHPPCSWCGESAADMAARGAQVGILSYGPFRLGKVDSSEFDERLPGNAWMTLETEHLRIASNLKGQSLPRDMAAELEPVLDRLRTAFPDIPQKVRKLDPWLRLHVMALRLEDFYGRFQEVLQVTDDDFPEERGDGPYMGNGKYLGVKDKFEIVFHSRRSTHQMLTHECMGVKVTDALRWYFPGPARMFASIPAEDGDLKSDEWLYPHTRNVLSHLFLCAYKHFAYDPPIWLDAGLAHTMEREANPLSTTMDGEEGGGPHRGGHQDWRGKDARLARRGKHRSLAEMWRVQTFSELSNDDNITAWSFVRFLLTEHPDEFARFLGGVKGQLDENGYPTGGDLPALQRRLFKEIWGWTPADFDREWKAWAVEQ